MASSKILFLSFAFAAIVCLTCIQCSTLTTSGLETVSDDNIVDMIKQNEFVIVLFCKSFSWFFLIKNKITMWKI